MEERATARVVGLSLAAGGMKKPFRRVGAITGKAAYMGAGSRNLSY